jgi:hypothetical protein
MSHEHFPIERLSDLSPSEQRDFWTTFEAELANDDGAVAREHLAAGHPIYYVERDTPAGLLIKRYPDGRRELIDVDVLTRAERVVEVLSAAAPVGASADAPR